MAAPSIVSSANTVTTSNTISIAVNIPSGITAGNTLLMTGYVYSSSTVELDEDWQIDSINTGFFTMFVATKTATSSEAAPTATFSASSALRATVCELTPSTLVTPVSVEEQGSSGGTSVNAPAVTADSDALIFRLGGIQPSRSFLTVASGTVLLAEDLFHLSYTSDVAGAISAEPYTYTPAGRAKGATLILESAAPSASITDIDGDNAVQVGQENVIITVTG